MANYSYPYPDEAYGAYTHAHAGYGNASPTAPRRASTQKELRRVDEAEVVIGRVFWLPPQEELPPRAVRRAHGKGAVEEGIYNHPVVVVSRPAEEPQVVHFHIVSQSLPLFRRNILLTNPQVTSFQGKRLHEIYSKDNEFHASRRSWYLPISPSPTHPHVNSKKMQKRYPTLELQHGATLRWDSYVNIRHVYKIDWTLLKPYANPDTPYVQSFRFDRESCDKMLAKTKFLTNYEPEVQHPVQSFPHIERPPYRQSGRVMMSHLPLRIPETQAYSRGQDYSPHSPRAPSLYSPKSYSDEGSVVGSEYSGLSPILQPDFGGPQTEFEMSTPVPKKRPPDRKLRRAWHIMIWILKWLWKTLCKIRERFLGR
ncbi:uncharacterized protein N0V89_002441 [Didymosphaeria variabile]|uniref:Uncharacterized protein n=1 Tax=Didymosphaeria variabile TaxID=1932322 RepID=A0A9W9CEI9_9PLEO|nr:uncharacterized protein N0V89_002441 [Didymosphaeria variabile]KAJ4357864.1 hypothetical protein N0V89_002441 [Didymosphaeria variabile]